MRGDNCAHACAEFMMAKSQGGTGAGGRCTNLRATLQAAVGALARRLIAMSTQAGAGQLGGRLCGCSGRCLEREGVACERKARIPQQATTTAGSFVWMTSASVALLCPPLCTRSSARSDADGPPSACMHAMHHPHMMHSNTLGCTPRPSTHPHHPALHSCGEAALVHTPTEVACCHYTQLERHVQLLTGHGAQDSTSISCHLGWIGLRQKCRRSKPPAQCPLQEVCSGTGESARQG